MNQNVRFAWLLLAIAAGMFVVATGFAAQSSSGGTFSCTKDAGLNKTIAPEAALEEFSCMIKKWEGSNTLHFNVSVKNVSNEDQRFKVNIFLENGKAVGGLLPRKTKKGLVKPGQIAKFTYPVKGVDAATGKIDLIIKTMSK